MQYTKIPGTDMQASRICLGTMTFGSRCAGPDAVRLVRYALEEHGVHFIDTANMYEGYKPLCGQRRRRGGGDRGRGRGAPPRDYILPQRWA